MESDKAKLELTLSEIKERMDKEQPNIQEITERLAKERVEEERRRFQHEKEQLTKDLQNRVEKVLKLEMELDEVKDAFRALESTLSREELQYKNKAQKLERTNEQINSMYQQVVNERSIMKVDISIAEKKCARKEEKII